MSGNADFLDRACAISEVRRTVWDANWGSVFPCANGSASDILTQEAVRGIPIADVPGTTISPTDATSGASNDWTKQLAPPTEGNAVSKSQGRRYQTLYILNRDLAPEPPTTSANPFATFVLPITLWGFLLLTVLGLGSLAILQPTLGRPSGCPHVSQTSYRMACWPSFLAGGVAWVVQCAGSKLLAWLIGQHLLAARCGTGGSVGNQNRCLTRLPPNKKA
jgi:hypothetical protein